MTTPMGGNTNIYEPTIAVFEGNKLERNPDLSRLDGKYCLRGENIQHQPLPLHLTEDLFSKHILILGAIGTGKTNAFLQIIQQLKNELTHSSSDSESSL